MCVTASQEMQMTNYTWMRFIYYAQGLLLQWRILGAFPVSVDDRSDMQCMNLFHPLKLELLIYPALLGHANMPKKCDGTLHFDDASERQVGICFQEWLLCNKCEYRSPLHKLYNEALTSNTGPKPAAQNLGIQVGLTHTGVGNGALRSIFMAAWVCPPAMSALQQHANKVGSQLIQPNRSLCI